MKRYIKKTGDYVIEFSGAFPGRSVLLASGWIEYNGTLPADRLSIVDGLVVELPPVTPTEEWVSKAEFISALVALIPNEQKQEIITRWETIAGVAMLPSDSVDLLDPRVPEFLSMVNLTVKNIRDVINNLEVENE